MTASIDGHIKLWKKQEQGIEFVKNYRAHLSTVVGISASSDGQLFASVAEDGTAKVFDVLNYGALRYFLWCIEDPWYMSTRRHDQHDKTWIHSPRVLLGTQAWDGSGSPRSVREPSCALFLGSS